MSAARFVQDFAEARPHVARFFVDSLPFLQLILPRGLETDATNILPDAITRDCMLCAGETEWAMAKIEPVSIGLVATWQCKKCEPKSLFALWLKTSTRAVKKGEEDAPSDGDLWTVAKLGQCVYADAR